MHSIIIAPHAEIVFQQTDPAVHIVVDLQAPVAASAVLLKVLQSIGQRLVEVERNGKKERLRIQVAEAL